MTLGEVGWSMEEAHMAARSRVGGLAK
jgi:hypothetical protein